MQLPLEKNAELTEINKFLYLSGSGILFIESIGLKTYFYVDLSIARVLNEIYIRHSETEISFPVIYEKARDFVNDYLGRCYKSAEKEGGEVIEIRNDC